MDELSRLAEQVRALVDRNEILDCLARYSRGMDRQDREMVRSAYHDDAIDLHGSAAFLVEDFIDWAFAYHEPQMYHQHYLTNELMEIDGDTAHVETYYFFIARYPDNDEPLFSAGGRYVDRFERRDDAWRIAQRVCTAEWRSTMPSVTSVLPRPNVSPVPSVTRDRDDVSYLRPLLMELVPRS